MSDQTVTLSQLESHLWESANILRGPVDAADFKTYIFPLLFFKRICDVWDEEYDEIVDETGDAELALFPESHRFQIPNDCHWNDVRAVATNVGNALQRAMREIEKANPDTLYGVFGDAQWTNKDRLSDALLKDLIEHFSRVSFGNKNVASDLLGDAYEYLIKKFADATNKKAGEFYTPRSVVRLMIDMLDPKEGETIYDPACGTGGMLLAAVQHVKERHGDVKRLWGKLYGQEKNLTTSSIARMNLFLHGIEDFQIVRGDTLRNPAFFEGDRLANFDCVIANPPFSLEKWGEDLWINDPFGRNFAGLPPSSSGDFAWVQHMVKSMAEGAGRMAVVLPQGALFRKGAEGTDIVMTVNANEPEYKPFARSRDEEERLLDRFRDPNDPLKLIIVTSKLLTGFDAPILQAMYLDKPLRDHTLLQAICRVNRTYSEQKTHGLIVDYLGIFDDVAKALEFDDKSVTSVVSNIQELRDRLPEAMQKCLAFFAGVDRTIEGYEGLIAAQQCLPNNEVRDNFAGAYSLLNKLWEAISPDPILGEYEKDYKWLSQVYQSVQPSSGHGKLIWHSLGAKTIELIHQNVHVDAVRDDLDTLVLDADLLEAVLSNPDPKKAKEIEIKVARRLRKHLGNPKFKALSERLDALRDRFESGVLNSVEFLKQLLQLAKEVLQAEKEVPPEEDEDRGKAALTELFNEVKTAETPIMVERVVTDIDEIVRLVRFPGWQDTLAGEREIKKALRKSLFKYKLHADEELFEKAYSYIRQYY